jgi:hypothetical protein
LGKHLLAVNGGKFHPPTLTPRSPCPAPASRLESLRRMPNHHSEFGSGPGAGLGGSAFVIHRLATPHILSQAGPDRFWYEL